PPLHAALPIADKAKTPGYSPEIVRPKAATIGAMIQDTAARAYRAGVPIAFGTDQGVGPHGDNAREFIYMVEAGMPAAFALQAATLHAADVLGVDDQGVLEPGMRADVIAIAGDPAGATQRLMDAGCVRRDGGGSKSPAR